MRKELENIKEMCEELTNLQVNLNTSDDDLSDTCCSIMYSIRDLVDNCACEITITHSTNTEESFTCYGDIVNVTSCGFYISSELVGNFGVDVYMDTTKFKVYENSIYIDNTFNDIIIKLIEGN